MPKPGSRPNEQEVIAHNKARKPIIRYSDDGPISGTTGNLEALALYAGQTVGLLHDVKPASQIITDLMAELDEAFNSLQHKYSGT